MAYGLLSSGGAVDCAAHTCGPIVVRGGWAIPTYEAGGTVSYMFSSSYTYNGAVLSSAAATEALGLATTYDISLQMILSKIAAGSKIDPMYCDTNVIGSMKKAWSMTTNGTSHVEASFFVLSSASGMVTTPPVSSHEFNKNTVNWVAGAIAFGHVHPNGGIAWPTPGQDTQYAGPPWNVTVFTFGSGGLWEFRNGYKKSIEIRNGLDWTKPSK
jgi:hypothetical protein